MIFAWLNDEECEVRESPSGEVVLALRFDREYVRWETQDFPNNAFTPDEVWDEVELQDAPARTELQLAREHVAMLPEGGARDAAFAAYDLKLNLYRDEIKDLAIQAATRRAKAALRDG